MKQVNDKIVEIITYVLAQLKQNKKISDIDVEQLEEKGYTSSEISTAFSWLVDRMEFQEFKLETDNSFRILHDAEKDLFTEEAWGELIQMNSLNLISNNDIETIIEKSLLSGIYKIDQSQLKEFVASIIFNANNSSLPGSRIMLKGNDTIN